MAVDIVKAKSSNNIKNYGILMGCQNTGSFSTYNYYVKNTPTITDIEEKYDVRFDDPSYYYGTGDSELLGV